MINSNLKVAILIPTKNRADFVIRQLRYYESVNCPHTIYVGDSSDSEQSEKIKNEIDKLKNKIDIVYKFLPNLNRGTADTVKHLLSNVKEKYSCYCCDDDYQIPNSLTICAEFLENNPDYATASGYVVHFRLKNKAVVYGELDRLSDCPIPAILDEKASDRLIHFLSDNFVPLFFVNRTDQITKDHEHVSEIEDHIFSSEIVPSSLSIIAGKSTTLDCLGYVRQIHDQHRPQQTPSEWIHSPEWSRSYQIFEDVTSENISKKDNIPIDDASKAARIALSGQLLKWLSAERRTNNASPITNTKDNSFYKNVKNLARSGIVKTFPFLKYAYRSYIKPRLTGKKEIHYEVLRPQSKYYKDFKPIVDSFLGPRITL